MDINKQRTSIFRIKDWGLLYKLIISHAVIFIVVLFIIVQMYYNNVAADVTRETIDYSSLYLRQLNENMNKYLNEFERLTAMPLADVGLQEILELEPTDLTNEEHLLNVAYTENFLFNLYTLQPDIHNIMLVDHRGFLYSEGIRRYSREDAGLHISTWYQKGIDNHGKVTYSIKPSPDVYTKYTTRESYLSIIRAVKTIGGDHELGVIRIDVPIDKFHKIIESANMESNLKIIVLDDEGQMLYDSDTLYAELDSNDRNFDAILEEGSMVIKGEKHIVLGEVSDYSHWTVYGFVPETWLIQESTKSRALSYVLILIGALASALISSLISYTVTRPLKKLQSAMKLVEKGEYETKIDVSANDEIGYLGHGFNEMTQRINDQIRNEYELTIRTRDAELKALIEEISPHFLYNTLDSIRAKANINEDKEVAEMIEVLATYLRLNIMNGRGLCTLSEEVTHIETYLKIHTMRYQSKFDYIIDIDDVIAMNAIPKLSLQPIVENAMLHGFKGMKSGCRLIIRAYQDQGEVRIEVIDNGIGLDDELVAQMNRSLSLQEPVSEFNQNHNHIGLNNVNQRAKIYFGERYGLSIESVRGKGSKVTIQLPTVTFE